jgi:hypothetical protein
MNGSGLSREERPEIAVAALRLLAFPCSFAIP